MAYVLPALKTAKDVMLFKQFYDLLMYMSGKMLLPRHADESKLRKRQLRFNTKYILILKFLFDLSYFNNCAIKSR